MFEVYFGNKRARKDYEGLNEKIKVRINKLCESLSQTPVPFREYDIRKIENRTGSYRARIGTYRVLYYIDEISHKIYIIAIEQRSETTYD